MANTSPYFFVPNPQFFKQITSAIVKDQIKTFSIGIRSSEEYDGMDPTIENQSCAVVAQI
jgi:hypothetical protein